MTIAEKEYKIKLIEIVDNCLGQNALFYFMENGSRFENKQTPEMKNAEPWWRPAMFIFFRASAWIAVPVVAALYLGRFLEDKYGADTHLLLITVAGAFLVTMIGLVKVTLSEFKKMDEAEKEKRNRIKSS